VDAVLFLGVKILLMIAIRPIQGKVLPQALFSLAIVFGGLDHSL
jgi:hypothetical protein